MKIPLKAITAALLTLLTSNWTAMSLAGDSIFDYILIDIFKIDKHVSIFIMMPISTSSLLASTLWLYKERKAFFPIRTIEQQNKVKPHKVMVALLSNVNTRPVVDKDALEIKYNNDSITLPKDLRDAKDHKELSKKRWPWQQLLRALYPHKDSIEIIYLIPSKESIYRIDDVKMILDYYGFNDKVKHTDGINFEDFGEVKDTIERIINELKNAKYKDDDIIVDITGGQKTASIAAAMAIINNYIKLQYVRTEEPYEVLSYNVVAEVPSSIS